jgi:CRP-like cAMP-binding protein
MKELLKQNIAKHISLSDKEMEEFCNLFQNKTIKKKDFLLREGEVCEFEGFVPKGLFRVYHIDPNGVEQILYLAMENWWITDDLNYSLSILYNLPASVIAYNALSVPCVISRKR